jgi:hypothetical protein
LIYKDIFGGLYGMDTIILTERKQSFNGVNYYLCGNYYQKNGKRLHRVVWEYHNGEIPKGYHVHHKDGNRHNNNISNLELMKAHEHESMHQSTEERKSKSRMNIEKAREGAIRWHKSNEGRAWHSAHAKEIWEERQPTMYTCDYCGKEYKTMKFQTTGNHFCSNNCKASFRRKSGVDNVTRECEKCGKKFVNVIRLTTMRLLTG